MTQAYYRKTPQEALEAQNASAEGKPSAQGGLPPGGASLAPKNLRGKKKSTPRSFWSSCDPHGTHTHYRAVISAFSGSAESTIVIFAVLVLNAILGTVQHFKAEKSLDSLKALSAPHRQGHPGRRDRSRPPATSCPATCWCWRRGDLVVADGRVVVRTSPFKVNEAPSPARARA